MSYPVVTKNNNNVDGIRGSRSNRVKHANTLAVLMAMTTTGACVFLKIICIITIDMPGCIRSINSRNELSNERSSSFLK